MKRFNWLSLPLILVAFTLAQDAPKPVPVPSLELSEAEKKDLTIANQALTILNQEYRLLTARMEQVKQQYQIQERARAGMIARIEKAKGTDVVCDAEKLVCAKKPAKAEAKPEKP